jgi:arylsulfatase A-like enzyme
MRKYRKLLTSIALGSSLAFAPAMGNAQNLSGTNTQTAAPDSRTSGPPNIILILADDLGIEGVNVYGGQYYTPNIDRLAQEGVRFENAHATPLCSPSRVRIMTGMQSWRNYDAFGYLAPSQRTFGNVLQNAGYATAIVGKWQLMGNGFDGRVGITPEAAGFDESYLWQLNALDAKGSRYWGPTRARNGRTNINEQGFGPDYDQQVVFDFISRHREQPFFLYYSMVLPHDPFVPTPASMSAEGDQQRFAGMVSYMDRLVGELMEKLKAEGLDENTVVIFTGDNGTDRDIVSTRAGHEIRGGKGLPTINGTHVPMIVWSPGEVPQGTVSHGLFDFTDVLPTLAEIAGAPVSPQELDGFSQWQVITGQQEAVRDTIFMHYAPAWQFEPARFVFDERWKLYGDGRFVEMDSISGTETELPVATLSGEALDHYTSFSQILQNTDDGPLDHTRYPWCDGQDSLDPNLPSTVAGCTNYPG